MSDEMNVNDGLQLPELPLEGSELEVAIQEFVALMLRLRGNFASKGNGAAFQGIIMTLGVQFPSYKEQLNMLIPSLPVRKRNIGHDTTVRQMRTTTATRHTRDCPTCDKKVDQSSGASGANVMQMHKIKTSAVVTPVVGSPDVTPGPVSSDQIGTIVTYDGVHGPNTIPLDEKWAGLLNTLPTLDSALVFYYSLTGSAYPASAPRDHISVLKAIHAYDDTVQP